MQFIKPIPGGAAPLGAPLAPFPSSTGQKISNIFSSVKSGATKLYSTSTSLHGTGFYVIMALLIGIIVALLVLVTDYFFHYLPSNPIGGPSAAVRAGKTFWKSVGSDTENLIVPASLSPTVTASNYTMTVQVVIGDTRTPSLGKFRHVVHRGSNPCGISAPPSGAGASGQAGIQPGDLPPDSDPTYVSLGLPQVMNPGLFLDAYKNDMHIFIHTQGTENNMSVLFLESLTVQDLPLNTPFTIGVVCNGSTLEVYLNCSLYSTMMLKGIPYLPKADNQWFGRYCSFPMTGLVKNLQLWSSALNVSDYRQSCNSASFDMSQVPSSSCSASASTSASSTSSASTASSAVSQAKSFFNLSND